MPLSCCLRDTHHPARNHQSSSSALRYTEVTRKNAKCMAADPTFTWAMSGPPTHSCSPWPCAGCPGSPLGHPHKAPLRRLYPRPPHPPFSLSFPLWHHLSHPLLTDPSPCSPPCPPTWRAAGPWPGQHLTCHGSSRGDRGDMSVPQRELALALLAGLIHSSALLSLPQITHARSVCVSQVWASLLVTHSDKKGLSVTSRFTLAFPGAK